MQVHLKNIFERCVPDCEVAMFPCFKFSPYKRCRDDLLYCFFVFSLKQPMKPKRAQDTIMFSFLLVAMFNESTEGGVELMIHLFIIILI